jgi:hypothetical protein
MSNSIRIRTTPGSSANIQLKVEQDFDFLEILSLKISQQDLYTSFCANYGVVVGRVIANKGFGVPNAKVSIFVPITSEDEKNVLIKDLYPFKGTSDKNKDNIRYNLLLSKATCDLNTAVGTFPTKEELLNNDIQIEVFEKYYKYTTKTNGAGDYMIFGVPTGQQTVHMDVDLSDAGTFSIRPYDLINDGFTKELFKSRTEFKSSNNLDTLPQIKSGDRGITVIPFWGDEAQCDIGITRVDFDTNYEFKPSSIMIGSIYTDIAKEDLNKRCNPNKKIGRHDALRTGPGELKAVRVTDYTYDDPFNPKKVIPLKLEEFVLPQGPTSIDDNGAFTVTVPMNLDHVITDEFGNLVPSLDPDKGVATKGMYRFKMKFLEPPASPKRRTAQLIFPSLNRNTGGTAINIKHPSNWPSDGNVGSTDTNNATENARWSENINTWKDASGNLESPAHSIYKDFHTFEFNQIYAISQYMTKYKRGGNRWNFLGVKDVDDAQFNLFPFTTIIKGGGIIYSILRLIIKMIAALMKLLITMVNFTFEIRMQLKIRISLSRFSATFTIIQPCTQIINIQPFNFLKKAGLPLTLECDSDPSFSPPKSISSWECATGNLPVCGTDYMNPGGWFDFAVMLAIPACLPPGSPSPEGKPNGSVKFHCDDPLCTVDKWLCCSLFDLAKDRNVLQYIFQDAWITGTAYMPQYKYKGKKKNRGTKDKFCGPGSDTWGGNNYQGQNCCNRGGGGFGSGNSNNPGVSGDECEKCVVRGRDESDWSNGNTDYHVNRYLTGAKDVDDMIYCPENFPMKIVNIGRTDACPEVVSRIDRCIASQECLIDLYKSIPNPPGCPATNNSPQPSATSACFTGTHYEGGYDTTQWVDDMNLTTYQDPALVVLKFMTNCSQGIEQLFGDEHGCGIVGGAIGGSSCDECEVNDNVWEAVRQVSKLYTDIILNPVDGTPESEDPNAWITWRQPFEADSAQAARFSPSAPNGLNDTDNKGGPQGAIRNNHHLAATPYFYFGLINGGTALDKLRKDYLVDPEKFKDS